VHHPNVELYTEYPQAFDASSVVRQNGQKVLADVVIAATGEGDPHNRILAFSLINDFCRLQSSKLPPPDGDCGTARSQSADAYDPSWRNYKLQRQCKLIIITSCSLRSALIVSTILVLLPLP